ncbi:hypothetical protein BU26DRAFT_87318 [Trematosphaeria pertusa]|uniref:Uncharacterized protein n=1 Tax=Trematosphaeria pertusa TaxID=390896 RepID=A0A6A6I3T2_9PLEO|nr:uncharacterized protein BU26DRAFT_87318 [Trematosphaeria pertusa]KAF2244839.1 hypothetical protein BU26DRAFT_87318 [Trematosphaeria pertusa]
MKPNSLKSSKYAPKTPLETLALSKAEKLKQEKEKATRLLGRLRWKAESLIASYLRAMEILHAEIEYNGHLDRHLASRYAFVLGTNSKQAESMFKVDFFEFYTLLERYITVCLGVLGVSVSATAPRTNVNALRFITNPDLQRRRPEAAHAFHQNLLEALDDENCALRASLGNQEVRIQLGLAKDYRNAWKDADENIAAPEKEHHNGESRKNVKLQDLDLERMLRLLLAGCEHAHGVVQGRDPSFNGNDLTSRDFEPEAYADDSMETDDVPFEYMCDAMDLD